MGTVNDPETIDRWGRALALRRSGVSYPRIAEKLGYSHASGAHYAVQEALKLSLRDAAQDVRDLEADRLDRLLRAAWGDASKGDPRAIGSVLAIMERRAKLLGLDAPARAAIETTVKGYAVGNAPDDLWTNPADSTAPTGPPESSGDAPTPS